MNGILKECASFTTFNFFLNISGNISSIYGHSAISFNSCPEVLKSPFKIASLANSNLA
jgi:hypothetical protein